MGKDGQSKLTKIFFKAHPVLTLGPDFFLEWKKYGFWTGNYDPALAS